jgi:hypothetical protein
MAFRSAGGTARSSRRWRGAAVSALFVVPLLLASVAVAPARAAGPTSGGGPARLVPDTIGSTGDHWSRTSPALDDQPFARAHPALTFDAIGTLGVLYGGAGPGGVALNDTWVNDGDIPGEWVNFSYKLEHGPPPLVGAALVSDRADGVFLMFGGQLPNGSAYGGTWELRALETWVQVNASPPAAPPAHSGVALTYDAADGYVLLYDPAGNGSTWKFLGGHWSAVPTASTPPARTGATLVYDPSDRAALLYGGVSASGARNDTWEYAGGAWREVASPGANPPASAVPLATYDPRSAGVVLYEGDATVSTWEFSQGGWAALPGSGATTPPGRTGAGFYYDVIVNYDILFGGTSSSGSETLADVWGWGVPPPAVDPTLAIAPFPPQEVALVVAAVAVPVVVAWLLRRRPPRKAPVSAPRAAASATPGA